MDSRLISQLYSIFVTLLCFINKRSKVFDLQLDEYPPAAGVLWIIQETTKKKSVKSRYSKPNLGFALNVELTIALSINNKKTQNMKIGYVEQNKMRVRQHNKHL